METEQRRTLSNSTQNHAKEQVNDLKVVGNGDTFQLLCKASSEDEGWMKSTKAMQVSNKGVLVQVTTYENGQVAEALCWVPGVKIVEDENGGRKLE